jgi:Uma2 family endonuclease
MSRKHAVAHEEDFPIPPDVSTLDGFLRWAASDDFPDTGRIDYLAGQLEVEMSPEDLKTHNAVKAEITSELHVLIKGTGIGQVFADGARVTSRAADLSVEPDAVAVLWETLAAGRARLADRTEGAPPQIEGAPDLVVEVVSRSSVIKDTKVLPDKYAKAGIPEFWRVDARGLRLLFEVLTLEQGRYAPVEPDAEGWILSPRLALKFRLRREPGPFSSWRYTLEHQPA